MFSFHRKVREEQRGANVLHIEQSKQLLFRLFLLYDSGWTLSVSQRGDATIESLSIDDANVNGNARKSMMLISENYFCT